MIWRSVQMSVVQQKGKEFGRKAEISATLMPFATGNNGK
jgi:hypothetical protein